MARCGQSVFGNTNPYIKIIGGDFVAIDGANTVEKLITNDLKIPYAQIMKSRVILKAGEVNYLLNHLGLGDNATFLLVRANYSTKSVIEEDNYVQWCFYDDLTRQYYMNQLLLLTGNSCNRVKKLFLTNPNPDYPVYLDVMAAVIDDEYSYFPDNQGGSTFVNLYYTSIATFVVGESIVINGNGTPPLPLIYIQLSNINTIQISSTILIINDSSLGKIYLDFVTTYDANQAYSLINYVLENPSVNIADLNPVADSIAPIVYFWSNVGNTQSGDYIEFNGMTAGVPYNTSYGLTFSTSISMNQYGGTAGIITKNTLASILINDVVDNRDGLIGLIPCDNLILSGSASSISATGSYQLTFNISDIAQNYINGVMVNINII